MAETRSNNERSELLADVAEMYYLRNMNQAQIAKEVGVTRSMISRLLTDAHRLGIVQISINRPMSYDHELEGQLLERFTLLSAHVVAWQKDDRSLLSRLGAAGAEAIKGYLQPGIRLGLPWGTTVSAVVDALNIDEPVPLKVIQLVGALGSRNLEYDGHGVVQRLAHKLDGQAYFLNAPFLMGSADTVRAISGNKGVQETLEEAERCDVALLGVGSTTPEYSSYYYAGYLQREELEALRSSGAVGGVCGSHFDVYGCPAGMDFENRCVSISRKALMSIPIRMGVAGGTGKADSILGAVRSGLINILVIDSAAANEVLRLDRQFPIQR